METKFEKLHIKPLKSSKILLECSQTLLEIIEEKMKNIKELIDLHKFNHDYCVESSIISLFNEFEQIKKFQTKANQLLLEIN